MTSVTSRDGTRIAYERHGDGRPLVLVDGALTSRSSESKSELIALLAPHFSVYSYDRRGRGDSADTAPYAVEREIEDVGALIELTGEPAFLYGHSSGGCLVLEAAEMLGDKVARVAVYEAPWNDDPVAQTAWGEYLHGLREALASDRPGDAVALFMQYVGTSAEGVTGLRNAPFWPSLEALAPTLAYDHEAIMGPTAAVPRDRLVRVTVPVLAMCGEASFAFMCPTAKTISEAVQDGRWRTLGGQSHAVQPAALASALIEFLGERSDEQQRPRVA